MQPDEAEMLVTPFPVDVPIVDVPVVTEPVSIPFKTRRVYLIPEVLEKYGVSVGCPGCEAKLAGGPAKSHSEGCRKRNEE